MENGNEVGNPQVRLCEIVRTAGSCGFNLTKSKWDPYPWVSTVDKESPAELAGVQAGDCLLEVNGDDVLGLRILEVANRMKARDDRVTVMLWNSGVDPKCTPEAICCGPMPVNLQRLSVCMSAILASLECPICLETIPPPAHQCANGHLICLNCRVRTEQCPVCRMKFFRGRSLLADQVFNSLIDAFDLRDADESDRTKLLRKRLCGTAKTKKKPEIKVNFLSSPTNKFLTRIMGSRKSSSAENLSESNRSVSSLSIPTEGEFYSGLKAKSLSTNEIFREEVQGLSRTASVLSSRPGSGLLDVKFSQRPASYHGSSEDLPTRLLTDFGIEFRAPQHEDLCTCPHDEQCSKQLPASRVISHLQADHDAPIVSFTKPTLTLDFPLPFPPAAILTIATFNTVFILKIKDYTCQSVDNHVWVWGLSGDKFEASIRLSEPSLSATCRVLPLSTHSWRHLNHECGVFFTSETMHQVRQTKCAKLSINISRC